MTQTLMERPEVGQQWTHRQYGGEYRVEDVTSTHATLDNGRMKVKALIELLHEHYTRVG